MTTFKDVAALLGSLEAALVEADRIGHTLAGAMISECIAGVRSVTETGSRA
jgi:hypothetical protein